MAVISPYFLENIYIRGANAEVWAMAWLPWVLWGTHLSLGSKERWRLVSLAIIYALFGLSHLPTLMIFTFLWVLMPIVVARTWSQLRHWIYRVYCPMILGLTLDGFFLSPAIFEQRDVNLSTVGRHGSPLTRTILSGLTEFSPQLPDHPYDFKLVPIFWMTGLVLFIVSWVYWQLRQHLSWELRRQTTLLLVCSFLAMVMMTDLGAIIYRIFPLLQKIQFAWRWMAITGVMLPFLWGLVLVGARKLEIPLHRQIALLLVFVVTLAMCKSVFSTTIGRAKFDAKLNQDYQHYFTTRPEFPAEVDLSFRPLEKLNEGMLLTTANQVVLRDVPEYFPKAAVPRTEVNLQDWQWSPPSRNYKLVEWENGSGKIEIDFWNFGRRRFTVDSTTGGILNLRMYPWPGWKVQVSSSGEVNNQQIEFTSSSDGRLQIPISNGQSTVKVTYDGTFAEKLGLAISIFALVACLMFYM